jgi:hypothetical protein
VAPLDLLPMSSASYLLTLRNGLLQFEALH